MVIVGAGPTGLTLAGTLRAANLDVLVLDKIARGREHLTGRGHSLIDVLCGQAPDNALDGYQQRRRPVAEQVVQLTDRATRLATLQGRLPRSGRNLAMPIACRYPRCNEHD